MYTILFKRMFFFSRELIRFTLIPMYVREVIITILCTETYDIVSLEAPLVYLIPFFFQTKLIAQLLILFGHERPIGLFK